MQKLPLESTDSYKRRSIVKQMVVTSLFHMYNATAYVINFAQLFGVRQLQFFFVGVTTAQEEVETALEYEEADSSR